MNSLKTARDEMAQIVAEKRVLRALRSMVPPEARYLLKPGELVRFFCEKERRWIGPFEVVKVEGKSIYLSDTTKVMKFNIVQVMLLKINHAAEDKNLETLFKHSDDNAPVEETVYLTELLDGNDTRKNSKKAREAVQKELDGIYSQGVFEEVHRKDIPSNAVILPSKFVYAIKKRCNGGLRVQSSLRGRCSHG